MPPQRWDTFCCFSYPTASIDLPRSFRLNQRCRITWPVLLSKPVTRCTRSIDRWSINTSMTSGETWTWQNDEWQCKFCVWMTLLLFNYISYLHVHVSCDLILRSQCTKVKRAEYVFSDEKLKHLFKSNLKGITSRLHYKCHMVMVSRKLSVFILRIVLIK